MCEEGECVEAPACYEAVLDDPCDTGIPDHCEGNILVSEDGHCQESEMIMDCLGDHLDCAPLTCVEDTSGAHCG